MTRTIGSLDELVDRNRKTARRATVGTILVALRKGHAASALTGRKSASVALRETMIGAIEKTEPHAIGMETGEVTGIDETSEAGEEMTNVPTGHIGMASLSLCGRLILYRFEVLRRKIGVSASAAQPQDIDQSAMRILERISTRSDGESGPEMTGTSMVGGETIERRVQDENRGTVEATLDNFLFRNFPGAPDCGGSS